MTLSDRIEQARNRRNLEAYAAEVSEVERRKRLDTIAAQKTSGLHWLAEESDLEILRRELTLDLSELAAAVGVSEQMLVRFQRGFVEPAPHTEERLDRIYRFRDRLYAVFEPYQAREWMRTPNERIELEIPVELLVAGAIHRIETALGFLEGQTAT